MTQITPRTRLMVKITTTEFITDYDEDACKAFREKGVTVESLIQDLKDRGDLTMELVRRSVEYRDFQVEVQHLSDKER